MRYDHQKIDKKWQDFWQESGLFSTDEKSDKAKFYCLDMFPYPSGVGLHVGHPRGYTATDIISRYKRMNGYEVLHPMGWDAFGLPAENYAIKNQVDVKKATQKNIDNFREQIKRLGLSYDWSRELSTTDPEYYKWTQWIFIQLFKKGLAYQSMLPINWCPSCKTGLANEEVINGECERCSTKVEKKKIRQWVLKITKYADRLLDDLESLDWPEKIKEMQRNWIGKSQGAEIVFSIKNEKESFNEKIKVFTTRADTLFGATFIVLSPEHKLIDKIKEEASNRDEIERYLKESQSKSDLERTDLTKEKSGVGVKGFFAINPADNSKIPIWVADYVLASYGHGAVMSVPAHDQRDYEFAKRYNLPIKEVVSGGEISKEAYIGEGELLDSNDFSGMSSQEARGEMVDHLEKRGLAQKATSYKLRDWIFSRQRYWGEPIPVIHCDNCGVVPLNEEDLPLKLPEVDNYQPTGTGESPLAAIEEWVETKCPKCNAKAKRETNTMPQWAGSCWYYLRFIDPRNQEKLISSEKEKKFMPVDLYVGGAEHAVLHLLYARFWHKFLYDIGLVSTKEPFAKLRNQGLILAQGGQKMSKSKGNVVSPDELVKEYGADAFRLYEIFIGPFEDAVEWNPRGIVGTRRFLEKVYDLELSVKKDDSGEDKLLHQTIKKVTEDIERFKFNTAISSLMILVNHYKKEGISRDSFEALLKMLSPFAPHTAEELWQKIGNKESIMLCDWPKFNKSLAEEDQVKIIVQVDGRLRETIEVASDLSQEEVKNIALEKENVFKRVGDKEIKKIVFIKNKLINFVL